MKIGASPGYFGTLGGVEAERAFAQEVEALGFDSLWIGEPYGNDAVSLLGWYAAMTSRITLGTGIMVIPGRTAAMTGQTAATVDLLSGGRLVLGLGTSGPQVSEGWHGVPFGRQLARTREYVDVVRMVVRRDRVAYDGETIQLPLPGGQGKALKLILRPPRAAVPIYLAALGPRNLELCGEIADGWLPWLWSPDHASQLLEPLARGAARAGRDVADIAVCPSVFTRIDDDLEAARSMLRPVVALYVGGMGPKDRNFYHRLVSSYGFAATADEVQERYLGGDTPGAMAAVTDELLDAVCLVGEQDRVAARLRQYAEAGADTTIVIPMAMSADDRLDQVRRAARAAAASGAREEVAAR